MKQNGTYTKTTETAPENWNRRRCFCKILDHCELHQCNTRRKTGRTNLREQYRAHYHTNTTLQYCIIHQDNITQEF
jgi:hypothetical protein